MQRCEVCFTADWEEGFSLKCFACVSPEWTYQFSQLKGSSDDGNATLKLHFNRPLMNDSVTEQVDSPHHLPCIVNPSLLSR